MRRKQSHAHFDAREFIARSDRREGTHREGTEGIVHIACRAYAPPTNRLATHKSPAVSHLMDISRSTRCCINGHTLAHSHTSFARIIIISTRSWSRDAYFDVYRG